MASPAANVVTGQFTATGAGLSIKTVGFRIKSLDMYVGGLFAHWQKDMADDSMYKRLANGTGSLVTSGGITPTTTHDGFTLGADADINVNGAVVNYVAICE